MAKLLTSALCVGMHVLRANVGRAVLHNTTDVEPSEGSKALLEKYLNDSRTTDIVYEQIIERVENGVQSNNFTLVRSLSLLKRYLIRYIPSVPVIEALEAFCGSLHITDNPTRQTLSYITALLARGMVKAVDYGTMHRHGSFTSSGPVSTFRTTGVRETRQLQEALMQAGWIYSNFLTQRCRLDLSSNPNQQFPCLSNHSLFGMFGRNSQQILPSERVKIERERIEERIRTVNQVKKHEEIEGCKKAGLHQRNQIQMFQFKCYNQQEKLRLQKEELTQVINGVVNSPKEEYETRLIASKILIKILVDRFIENAEDGSQFFLDIISNMLESEEIETKIHSFNLLLNLSVHFHLWQEMSIIVDNSKSSEEKTLSYSLIIGVQSELFDVLQQMIQILVQAGEQDERLWAVVLNCLLFWITKEGKLQKNMVHRLEISMLLPFFKYTATLGDFVHRNLVRLITALLYDDGLLSKAQLKKIGGIFFVIEQYSSARSVEAQDNLFTIIYDYIGHKEGQPVKKNDLTLNILQMINAPQIFRHFFKVLPPVHFEDIILNFLGSEGKWQSFTVVLDGVDESSEMNAMRSVLTGFKDLFALYLALPDQFTKLYETSVELKNTSALIPYLYSERADNRKFAELWLFKLLSEHWFAKKETNSIGRHAEEIFAGLLSESREEFIDSSHSIFISIIERISLSFFFHDRVLTSSENSVLISFLNEYVLRMLDCKNVHENNIRRVFDVLWNFVLFDDVQRTEKNPYHDVQSWDCIYSLFVNGATIFPLELRNEMDIRVFAQLFECLGNKNYAEMRLAVFLVMVEKSMQLDNLEKIGGIPFYRKLLASSDSAIAYHASRFLIDQLEAEKPEDYKIIMAAFLTKAQQTKNERLVSNSYLQISELIHSSE